MKTIIIAALMVTALAACTRNQEPEPEPQPKEVKMYFPEGMKDCVSALVPTEYNSSIFVVRCPNSTTSVRYGKSGESVTVEK